MTGQPTNPTRLNRRRVRFVISCGGRTRLVLGFSFAAGVPGLARLVGRHSVQEWLMTTASASAASSTSG